MKFEMEFGWTGNEKITIETYDFDKIKIIQAFVEYQEQNGWLDDSEDDYDSEIFEEEDTEDEEVVLAGLDDNA
jgi:major membrane immunogen (membrane-anchored lipoprotein)